ncbi:hypothetical protein RF11_05697 [Thelohanellus kitauei]|uniref:Uncharacterized protein n=1 Tax=Thelohanellus kitauei TaxID=669202 RepID=A0A0C2N033_THEKT|nr:hypothetical protein RF11_05697 [Thelohanellus kitauei]
MFVAFKNRYDKCSRVRKQSSSMMSPQIFSWLMLNDFALFSLCGAFAIFLIIDILSMSYELWINLNQTFFKQQLKCYCGVFSLLYVDGTRSIWLCIFNFHSNFLTFLKNFSFPSFYIFTCIHF